MADIIPDYDYHDVTCWSHYLWPAVKETIETHNFKKHKAFDLGCGNGSISSLLSGLGFDVIGVDPSESGIRIANRDITDFACRRRFHRYPVIRVGRIPPLAKSMVAVASKYETA